MLSKLIIPITLTLLTVLALGLLSLSGVSGDGNTEDIPVLPGSPHCLESNLPEEFNMNWFELKWRLNKYKEYYQITNKLDRSFVVSRQVRLQSNRNNNLNGYTANIIFILPPSGSGVFCDFTYYLSTCKSWRSRDEIVEMQIYKGQEAVDLFQNGYEFEGELWYRSSTGSIKSGARTAQPSELFTGLKFDFSRSVNITEFDRILGIDNKEDSIELGFVIKQFKWSKPVLGSELQSNCKFW